MRGTDDEQSGMFSYISAKDVCPKTIRCARFGDGRCGA